MEDTGERDGGNRPSSSRSSGGSNLAEALADVVFELDGEGYIVTAGGSSESPFGYDRTEIIGTPFASLLSDTGESAGIESAADIHRAIGPDETVRSLDISIESKDGKSVPVSFSAVRREDGGIDCALIDRTEQRGRERRHEQYAELFETMNDPMYVLDESGVIEQVNDALVAYTGYDRSELLGRSIEELVPTREYEDATTRLKRLITENGDESFTFETTLVTSTGELVLSEANVSALIADDGTYTGSVGTLRDIRQRKQREQDLELLKQVLTRVFRHNVRNKLNVIRSHADLARRRSDEEVSAHLDKILETSAQLLDHSEKATLIEQVLDTDAVEKTDLSETVERTVERYRQAYPEATLEVTLPDRSTVMAHPNIENAIAELIDNAVQHATGSPTANIRIEESSDFVTLLVEDNSGGLADHELDVLRRGTESDLKHASGVGLWLVRWLVQASGAGLIAHRTEAGSLMGIQFARSTESPTRMDILGDSSPFVPVPDHARSAISRPQTADDAVAGRAISLQQLEEVYSSLDRTGGHVVVVTGEMGVGKSTLVEEFCRRLDETAIVCQGACSREPTRPYSPIRQAMTALSTSNSRELFRGAIVSHDAEPETIHARQQALFASVASSLREAAADGPVVFVVEDIHWANRATIDLLDYLIDEVGQWATPVLFLLTCRETEIEAAHPVQALLDRAGDEGREQRLELGPLERDQVQAVLRQTLGIDQIPAEFVDAVYERTGGNPLFLAELTHHILDAVGSEPVPADLQTTLSALSVPDTIDSAIGDRIDGLLEPVQTTLFIGALAGDALSLQLLREATDVPETTLIEYSNRLVRRRLWERGDGGLSFTHDSIREKALQRLPEERRAELHARVAGAIETLHGEERAAQLGVHYQQAGEAETALRYYREAGHQARETYASEEAIEYYERAIALAGELPDSERHIALLCADIATTAVRTGEYERVAAAIDDGLRVAPEHSRERCRLYEVHAIAQVHMSEYDEARETAQKQHDIATALGLTDLTASALRRLGVVARKQGEYDSAKSYLEEALSSFREVEDRQGEAETLADLGIVTKNMGEYRRAETYYQKALELARDIEDRHREATILSSLGVLARREGEYEQARAYCLESIDICRDIGDRRGEGRGLNNLALVAARLAEYDRAQELYEQCLEINQEIGERQGEAVFRHNIADTAYKRGQYDRAWRDYNESLQIERELGNRHGEAVSLLNLASVARERGSHKLAREYYEQALELAAELELPSTEANCLSGLGRLARLEDEYDTAREYLQDALDRHENLGDEAEVGEIHLELGRIESACERFDVATHHADRARERFTDLDQRHHLARSHRLLGRLDAATGNTAAARTHWERALETFEAIDAPQDTLPTLRYLLDLEKQEQDTTDRFESWCRQASDIVAAAPEPVAEQHREWVERANRNLDDI